MYILLSLILLVSSEHVYVEMELGVIIGETNDGYNTFFGVPYAKVPSDPFAKATQYPNFTTPFYANDSSVMCPQVAIEVGGIMQCLRLNIYVPHSSYKSHAVLVWFPSHLNYGSANDYGGQHLTKENIIVVTVNFRLGFYGFSCLKEPYYPGNMGLRDQYAALRWIQRNIIYFGGNPNAVTIGGQGYGGGFVDIHMHSEFPVLFDKVIIQSGSIFSKGFFGPPNPSSALLLAKHFGKSIGKKTKPRDVLAFLSQFDPIQVQNATKIYGIQPIVCREKYYKMGISNVVLNGPLHLKRPDKIRGVKILIGYNSMELLSLFAGNRTQEFYDTLSDVFFIRLKQNFHMKKRELDQIGKRVKKFYMGGKLIGPETRIQVIESGSDFYLNHPMEISVDNYVAAGATLYKYMFSYDGGSDFKDIAGASHEEEMKYLFEMKSSIKGQEQHMMRNELVKYWANFVKFGNPTPNGEPLPWEPVIGTDRPYLDINVPSTMKDHAFRERMAFWDLLWYAYQEYSMLAEL